VSIATPEWLARHDCTLQPIYNGTSWLVLLDNEPQYLLVPIPVAGTFGCAVTQTINGKRLEGGATYPSLEDAGRGGLEDLRKALGW
jgi:hypothetical protein